MTENQENRTITECLNCHQQLLDQATFCPNCGQKRTTGLISLKEFIHNFIDNVFNLDSRIVQTLKWLFIPAKLTKEYFKGKHKTYYHPIRLYLVISIVFFAALNLTMGDLMTVDLGKSVDLKQIAAKEEGKEAMLVEIDSFKQKIATQYKSEQVVSALDSLQNVLENLYEKDSFYITLNGVNMNIDPLDAANLSGRELADKYQVEGLWNRLLIKQVTHFFHDQAALSRQVFNNIPLMLLAMIPFLALFLKLLYWKEKRFYVEHLVLNFHYHAFAFFLFSIILLLPNALSRNALFFGFGLITVLIFLFLTMKSYYDQSLLATFFKYMLFNIFYAVSFFLVLCITLFVSFLFF